MTEQTFREMLRKKVVDLKPTEVGFYTESYNIVYVFAKLTTEPEELVKTINEKMALLYRKPLKTHNFSLPQLEQLYFKYKDDANLKIKAKRKTDIYDIKGGLDKARRDLLFYLAILEDQPKSYDIKEESSEEETLEEETK